MPDYDLVERLGAGNFGEVWRVYDRALDVTRAVKFVDPSRIHDPTNFYSEPRTLMDLRHPNIVRVEDAGTMPDGRLYFAMELLPNGSLATRYRGRPVPLRRACEILCDACWGLEYAHQRNYVHRDIKPANILVGANGSAKLSDFGLATRVPRGQVASPGGYLTHVAPEVFRDSQSTTASDIYALGVTAYRLVNGDAFLPPLTDAGEIRDAVLSGEYPDRSRYRPFVPAAVRRIINRAMAVDRADRFQQAADLRRALERLVLHCDWTWISKKSGVRYRTKIGDATIMVRVAKDGERKREIMTTKRVGAGEARRVARDCVRGLTVTKLKKEVRRILSRYTSEGR